MRCSSCGHLGTLVLLPSSSSRALESSRVLVAQMGKRGVHRSTYRKFLGVRPGIGIHHSGQISIGQNLVTAHTNCKRGWKKCLGRRVHSIWRVHRLCPIERGPLTGPRWGLAGGAGRKGELGLEQKAASLCPPDFSPWAGHSPSLSLSLPICQI